MPYVEVWVDERQFNEEQVAAIGELVASARDVADRLWPSDDAALLQRAINAVIGSGIDLPRKIVGGDLFPRADEAYRRWLREREERQAAGNKPEAAP